MHYELTAIEILRHVVGITFRILSHGFRALRKMRKPDALFLRLISYFRGL